MPLQKIEANELKKILEEHEKWSETNGADGSIANIYGADLRDADLAGANLENASLVGASLWWGANLRGANLRGANLENASLVGASLVGASLAGAITKYGTLIKPVICMTLTYFVFISQFHVKIGCKDFTHAKFLKLTEEDAFALEGERAVNFYKTYRPLIVAAIETYADTDDKNQA